MAKGDLKDAALWQANVGRSLSLGDFAIVNAARTDIGEVPVDDRFYVLMAQAVVAHPRPGGSTCAAAGEAGVCLFWGR